MASYEEYLKRLGHKKCTKETLFASFDEEEQTLKVELSEERGRLKKLEEQKEKLC
jgi:hypothetical protein